MNVDPVRIIISFVVVIISLTFHELAHAAAANALGDPTAKNQGRLSTNPLVHIDPVGTILLPLVLVILGLGVFGWAKPVPVNPANLRNLRRDNAIISAAGPLANLILAILSGIAIRILIIFSTQTGDLLNFVFNLLYLLIIINIYLMLFNLLPIPPLDGSGILQGILTPRTWYKYKQMSQKLMFVFLAILFMTNWFHTFYLQPASRIFLFFIQYLAGVQLI